MRRHAKASLAGSTPSQGRSLGRIFRGTFATRGASSGDDGSGAHSGRVRRFALGLLVAVFSLAGFAGTASASQEIFNRFGNSGNLFGSSPVQGGEFSNPGTIGVNSSGAGAADAGDLYVADTGNNRIQRFDSGGNFISAWGANVINRNEEQWITGQVACCGTYTLTLGPDTTAPIAYNAGAAAVDNALDVLPTVGGDANVTVTDGFGGSAGHFTVKFVGVLAGTDLPELTVDTSGLTGFPRNITVGTVVDGSGGGGSDYEICTEADKCSAGVATGGNTTVAGNGSLNQPTSVAVDNDTGDVYVSDRLNRRINVYEGDGTFLRSFGWNVNQTEAGTEYEVCPATDVCKAGVGGSGVGQYGAAGPEGTFWEDRAFGIAVSQADGEAAVGTVFLANSTNRRVNTYNLDGTSPASIGSAAVFGTTSGVGGITQPTKVAVDSRGILYASNSAGGGQIDRYDTEDANGGGVGFLAPIPASRNERQKITFTGMVNGDKYTLTCPNGEETLNIIWSPFGEGVTRIESMLNNRCGAGSFDATGNSSNVTVDFEGTFMSTDVPNMTCTIVETSGVGACSVETVNDGGKATLLNGGAFPGSSTRGMAVHPDSDGGGPDTDVLYVYRTPRPLSLGTQVQQLGPVHQPGLTEPPSGENDVDDIHGSAAKIANSEDMGFNDATGQLLVGSTGSVGGQPGLPSVYIMAEPSSVPDPALAMDLITEKGETTATFSGSVDPSGFLVTCDYQYSTDQENWIDVDANGARAQGKLHKGSTTVTGGSGFKVGEEITADNGAIPPGTTITNITGFGTLTLSQPATASGFTLVKQPGCKNVDPGGGPQPLSTKVTGLDPNTHYFVRLTASRPYVENSTVIMGGLRTFDTDKGVPIVSDVGSIQVKDTSARLVGTIDPRNDATGYVFLYGTTPALGSSTAPVDIGGGTTPITVSQVVSGLTPDTTYHFKLQATNSAGSTTSGGHQFHTRATPPPPSSPANCSNEALRIEQQSTFLPDCRAYEMVSPPDKNLGSVDTSALGETETTISLDGNSAAYCPSSLFGEPSGQMLWICAIYLSQRGENGWTTVNPIPRSCRINTDGEFSGGVIWAHFSGDHSRFGLERPEFDACGSPPIDPAAPTPASNLYLADVSENPFSYTLMTTNTSTVNDQNFKEIFGGSDDFSHVVYRASRNETSDSPPEGLFYKVYEFVQSGEPGCAEPNGCIRLVSKKPNGEPFTTASNYPDVYESDTMPNRATSADGERIFFQNPAGATLQEGGPGSCTATCDAYVRRGGTETIEISASECTEDCGSGNNAAKFKWATPNGKIAFFYSCEKLTDESAPTVACGNSAGISHATAPTGGKIYRWDENAPPGHQLVDITIDKEPADGIQPSGQQGGGFQKGRRMGLIGTSDDGNTVFFGTDGQLIPGKPLTTPASEGSFGSQEEGTKLYRWQSNEGSPTLDYLGHLNPIVGYTERGEIARAATLTVRWVSPNGKYLMLETTNRMIPHADRDNDRDIYRWDEAGGWRCVSCQLPGVASAGDSSVQDTYGGTVCNKFVCGELGGGPVRAAMTDDGRVFFNTPDALVPGDINGEVACPGASFGIAYTCEDVYEWNDGTVSLISSGTASKRSFLIGADYSGDNVFFFTESRLVGHDKDNGADIYTARVGGGFPEPTPEPPTCEGEACRGQGTAPASADGAGTAVFEGPGNQTKQVRKGCRRGFVKRRGKCVSRKKLARERAARKRARRAASQSRRANR